MPVGGLFGEKMIRWHLEGLNKNLHFLEYSYTMLSAFSKLFKLGPIKTRSSTSVGLPSFMEPIVQPVLDFCSFCNSPSMKSK